MEDFILRADHVSYAYEDEGGLAVRDVSISFRKGEMTAVLGHNGSGKSTLAKLLNGLYIPTEGTVHVCGMDTQDEERTWDIRRSAGMVFQNPDNQLVASIVRDDVAFGLENIGVPTAEMPARVEEALELVKKYREQEAAEQSANSTASASGSRAIRITSRVRVACAAVARLVSSFSTIPPALTMHSSVQARRARTSGSRYPMTRQSRRLPQSSTRSKRNLVPRRWLPLEERCVPTTGRAAGS